MIYRFNLPRKFSLILFGLSVLSFALPIRPKPIFAATCNGVVVCGYVCAQGTCDYDVPCSGTDCPSCDDFHKGACIPGDWEISNTCGWSVSCTGPGADCDNTSGGSCPGASYGDSCANGNGTCEQGPPLTPHKCSCEIDSEGDTAPTTPTNVNPPSGSTGWGSTVTYGYNVSSWGSCSGGNVNRSNVFQTSVAPNAVCPAKPYPLLAGCTNVSDSSNPINCPSTPLSRSQATKYCWYANATNGCMTSPSSPTWVYVTCIPTSPSVSLTSPANLSSVSSSTVPLSWSGAFGTGCWSNANDYTVYRATKTGASCPAFSTEALGCEGLTTQTTCTTTGLTVGSAYCWRVGSTNGSLTATSPTWEFCYGSGPTAPTLDSPAPGVGVSSLTPTLDWSHSGWGSACGSTAGQKFKLYTLQASDPCPVLSDVSAPGWTPQCEIDASTGSYATQCNTALLAKNTNYCWGVGATNGNWATGSNAYSTTRSFRTPVDVTGLFWDASGALCTTPTGLGQLNDDSIASLSSGVILYQDQIDAGGNFEILNVVVPATGSASFTLGGSNLNPNPGDPFIYELACYNGNSTTGTPVTIPDLRITNSDLELGFEKVALNGWTQTIFGDIFVNCTNCSPYGISQAIPPQDLGNTFDTNPYMVDYTGSLTNSSSGLAFTHASDMFVEDWVYNEVKIAGGSGAGYDNYNIKKTISGTGPASTLGFPSNIDFNSPPSTAITVPNATLTINCTNFIATNNAVIATGVYRTDPTCFRTMLQANRTYNYRDTGSVILYVVSSDSELFTFSKTIQSADTTDRLILVIDGSVAFASTLPATDPSPLNQASPAQLAVSIIANGSISSQSTGQDPADDRTLIVNGLLMASDYVSMNRNKGVNNTSPSELIRYIPKDLVFLNASEMGSGVPATALEYTGLYITDIKWEIE